uniref:outer membrane beta-barrel protein n=1 Tax=Polaribacter septentrionalilitoris TaxID=2494657 RepID=UPI001F241D85
GETKKLVSTKKAMEKIFLGDNSTKKTTKIEKNIQKKNTVAKVQTSDKKFNHLQKNESKKIDFTKAIKKTDSIFSTSDLKKRWSIAPTFAVLSSNSFSKSSPINQNLSSSTRGQNSVSYGVQVNYKLNSKWTIQSGIHVLETRFRNNNVVIGVITNSVNSNIIFNNQNSKVLENNAIANNTDLVSNSFARLNTLSGDLSQNYGYIEIPVEIKYSFYNTKKFNTEIVGGFSSLFLTQNKIDISSQFISTSGLANNLNALNFSGNLGLDFNYLINNHWSFNLNPMFKAQLNTFSQRSNGFRPFNVGIYTGLKYRF